MGVYSDEGKKRFFPNSFWQYEAKGVASDEVEAHFETTPNAETLGAMEEIEQQISDRLARSIANLNAGQPMYAAPYVDFNEQRWQTSLGFRPRFTKRWARTLACSGLKCPT